MPYKDKKKVASDLRKIYTAVDRDHAERELEAFAETWDEKYPMISASWIEHWERIVPFLAFSPDVPRVVYTTDEKVKGLLSSTRPREAVRLVRGRGRSPCEAQGLGRLPAAQLLPSGEVIVAPRWRRPRPLSSRVSWLASQRRVVDTRVLPVR